MGKLSLNAFIEKIGADEEFYRNFLAAIRGGENSIKHNKISQSVVLEDSWILTIESGLYSIEQIVRNPRKFIAESDLLLDVSKVRRINSKTVRHLSSHSQYVQNIEKNGDVMPKKLLTFEMEEDIAIYENRFICALVLRLISFVEQRHLELKNKIGIYDETKVSLQSDFEYGGNRFQCELNFNVQEPPEDLSESERNKELFERIELIRRRLIVLQATDFIKILSNKKPVRPPIQKTNLLMGNVDYHNCYNLWLFISAYTALGYEVEISDKNLPVDGDYYDDLTVVAGLGAQSLITDNILKRELYDAIDFNPPQEKQFAIVNDISYRPSFANTKEQAGAESINEYYFNRMKEELIKLTEDEEIVVEKHIESSFTKFYRSVSRINDELYDDLIERQTAEKEEPADRSPIGKKRAAIRKQQEIVKRRNLLLKLKWEELEKAQRIQERAQAKLNKLKQELIDEKEKTKNKKLKKIVIKAKSVKTKPAGSSSNKNNGKKP